MDEVDHFVLILVQNINIIVEVEEISRHLIIKSSLICNHF